MGHQLFPMEFACQVIVPPLVIPLSIAVQAFSRLNQGGLVMGAPTRSRISGVPFELLAVVNSIEPGHGLSG